MKKFRVISIRLDISSKSLVHLKKEESSYDDANQNHEKGINEHSSPINIITKRSGKFQGPNDIDLLPALDYGLESPSVSPGTSPLVIGNHFLQPPSPRTLSVRKNSILYSLGRNGKILTFAHSDYIDHKNHCINLRHENKYHIPPLDYEEYFHESNKYCICMITDYERKNVKVMGFILYRKKSGFCLKKKTLYCYKVFLIVNIYL